MEIRYVGMKAAREDQMKERGTKGMAVVSKACPWSNVMIE